MMSLGQYARCWPFRCLLEDQWVNRQLIISLESRWLGATTWNIQVKLIECLWAHHRCFLSLVFDKDAATLGSGIRDLLLLNFPLLEGRDPRLTLRLKWIDLALVF